MATHHGNRPAEIFGYPIGNTSIEAVEARRVYWCPFQGKTCTKASRLLDYPFGVCSVEHHGIVGSICPHRFKDPGAVPGKPRVIDGYSPTDASRFALYDIAPEGDRLVLTPTRFLSSSVNEFFQAMRDNPLAPSKDRFIELLNRKLDARLRAQLAMGGKAP